MDHTETVVCFGHDPILLESRRKLLATRFRAISVASLEALHKCIVAEDPRLLVVCHTVPEDDCLSAIVMARTWTSVIRTVVLTWQRVPIYPQIDTIRVNEGPLTLLNRLSELLGGQNSGINKPDNGLTTLALSHLTLLLHKGSLTEQTRAEGRNAEFEIVESHAAALLMG